MMDYHCRAGAARREIPLTTDAQPFLQPCHVACQFFSPSSRNGGNGGVCVAWQGNVVVVGGSGRPRTQTCLFKVPQTQFHQKVPKVPKSHPSPASRNVV